MLLSFRGDSQAVGGGTLTSAERKVRTAAEKLGSPSSRPPSLISGAVLQHHGVCALWALGFTFGVFSFPTDPNQQDLLNLSFTVYILLVLQLWTAKFNIQKLVSVFLLFHYGWIQAWMESLILFLLNIYKKWHSYSKKIIKSQKYETTDSSNFFFLQIQHKFQAHTLWNRHIPKEKDPFFFLLVL